MPAQNHAMMSMALGLPMRCKLRIMTYTSKVMRTSRSLAAKQLVGGLYGIAIGQLFFGGPCLAA